MPVGPANPDTRLMVSDILSKFVSDYAWSEYTDEPFDELRRKVVDKYGPHSVDSRTLRGELKHREDVEMREQHRFLYLERIEDKRILPLVTLQSSHEWVHFRIYALLTTLDEESELRSIAIRFETDEGNNQSGNPIGSHDFCHAQLCNQINNSIKDVAPMWIPDSQLAIPLDAENQIGLVLCMLTSLYGGRHVRGRFNQGVDRNLLLHLNEVRALHKL